MPRQRGLLDPVQGDPSGLSTSSRSNRVTGFPSRYGPLSCTPGQSGRSTLGFDTAHFQTTPPACYRAPASDISARAGSSDSRIYTRSSTACGNFPAGRGFGVFDMNPGLLVLCVVGLTVFTDPGQRSA
jgi:hypothetical protein